MAEEKQKKPIYKRWTFWGAIILVMGIFGAFVDDGEEVADDGDEDESVDASSSTETEEYEGNQEVEMSVDAEMGDDIIQLDINTNLAEGSVLHYDIIGEDIDDFSTGEIEVTNSNLSEEIDISDFPALDQTAWSQAEMIVLFEPSVQSEDIQNIYGETGENIYSSSSYYNQEEAEDGYRHNLRAEFEITFTGGDNESSTEEYKEFIQENYDYMDNALSLVGMTMQEGAFEDDLWVEEMQEDLAHITNWHDQARDYDGDIPEEHEDFHDAYVNNTETLSEHAQNISDELDYDPENMDYDALTHDMEMLSINAETFRQMENQALD
ncbi:hypothetical protein HUG15_05840 [Salicibibacter cibarius]|uniref:Uncharacterized protein n=1 Tax=Salicibibacter cibarius TaxID=2743000 RepID=A0A7T6Z190_9BACI|nr:hypothetical protein [Salicibibacter cibarius]QQK75115.1 hypothetical protein HUG15_05510 [Salicibibacter cibarius]QQK75175.1 hypothetical protein HUG15_05840 [Salicibibacter cibarius]